MKKLMMASVFFILCIFIYPIQSYDNYVATNYSTSDNGGFVARTGVSMTTNGANSDVAIESNEWKINPTSDNEYKWALWVCENNYSPPAVYTYFNNNVQALIGSQKGALQNVGPEEWGFHPRFPSTIKITIYGTSTTQSTTGDGDLLISIASGGLEQPNLIQSISALIQLDAPTSNGFSNKISPSCSGGSLNTEVPINTISSDNTKLRWQNVMGADNVNNLNDWLPVSDPLSGTQWPISFEVTNYPSSGQSHVKLITPSYNQSCWFDEAFSTEDEGIDVYIHGGKSSEEIRIGRFQFEHWWDYTLSPTSAPTDSPSLAPTNNPTSPTKNPTESPSEDPTFDPTADPTFDPTTDPTKRPTDHPTTHPSTSPTSDPTADPTQDPTHDPTADPTVHPTSNPTQDPTIDPTSDPTTDPTHDPTTDPTVDPTKDPTTNPTFDPTVDPTADPTHDPTTDPTIDPTRDPTTDPTFDPTADPTQDPTDDPTSDPTIDPTQDPTSDPTFDPTADPTVDPTVDPTIDPTNDPTSDPTFDPTYVPSVVPTDYPTGAPTFYPTHKPTEKPTRKPTGTERPTKTPTTPRPTESPTASPIDPVSSISQLTASTEEIVTVLVSLVAMAAVFLIFALIQAFVVTREKKREILSAEDDRDGDGRRDDFGSIDGLHLFAKDAIALEAQVEEEENEDENETDEEDRINEWFANKEKNGLLEEVPNDTKWDWQKRNELRSKFEAQFEGSASSDL